ARVAKHGRTRTAHSGEILAKQGDRAVPFFVVISGELEVARPTGTTEAPSRQAAFWRELQEGPAQQVTCRIAFVSGRAAFNSSMAWAVGKMRNSILRRWASFFTSSITGKAPVPVPITR